MTSRARTAQLAALIAGVSTEWPELQITTDELIELCEAEDLSPLIHQRLTESSAEDRWPRSVRDALALKARAAAGEELLRGADTRQVLAALAAAGVRPLLIKGTSLAYSLYPTPSSRPRCDTDFFISSADVERARRVMAELGYTPTVYCAELFSQFEVQKTDRFGVTHAYDVHWKISTQPVFADVLTYDEMLPRAMPLPLLGPAALAPSLVDALLLACVHPVMHHQNIERVMWTYDVHLLASRLGSTEFDEFVELARHRRVATICAHSFRLAQTAFQTPIPARAFESLSRPDAPEPSAEYLASQRRWHDELASSVRGLPHVGDRVRLLRQVLLPSPSYMLGAYGLRGKPLAAWLLPALYVHRNVRGAWRILTGKK